MFWFFCLVLLHVNSVVARAFLCLLCVLFIYGGFRSDLCCA